MKQEGLLKYCSEVLRFRKALNLTSVKSEAEFMSCFVEPSVALSEWMPERGRLLDIGSGMGVPGVPLLIAKPGLQGVLVERRKKRAEFLRHLVRVLKLDAEVYDADINDLPGLGVDVCVARAVTHISGLLEMCTPHVNHGAVAVFPVPQRSEPVCHTGWMFEHGHTVQAVEAQQVLCYRYHGDNLIQGDVSRET
jgi:16S rRNA (guanine(527)-N(7))-methyltransferase RsmG